MTLDQLEQWVKVQSKKYPKQKEKIFDLYDLCINEIEEGGSPDHEIYLCIDLIEQLIEEEND
jgi:hypothetical protein